MAQILLQINNLNGQINTLNGQIVTLQNEKVALYTSLDSGTAPEKHDIRTQIMTKDTAIVAINNQIPTINNQIAALLQQHTGDGILSQLKCISCINH